MNLQEFLAPPNRAAHTFQGRIVGRPMTRMDRLLVVTPNPATLSQFASSSPSRRHVSFSQDGLHAAMRAIEDLPDLIVWDAAINEPDPRFVLASLRRNHRTASIAMIVMVDAVDRRFVRRMRQAQLPIIRKSALTHATPLYDELFRHTREVGRTRRKSLIH